MALPGHTVYDTADEDMRELHVQPAPRVRDEIKAMNLNHEWSYALAATTLTEQARREDTFYGDAHYYDLRKKKALETIHGTYLIVYARPQICEEDEDGHVVAEIFEPDIKNTLCIFTKRVTGTTEGHTKVNEFLHNGLPGVGMLHFKSRNMTIWMKPQFSGDRGTTIEAQGYCKQTPEGTIDGLLENRLYYGPSKEYASKLSFGATRMQIIQDYETGHFLNHGFEWVRLEFPSYNDYEGNWEYFTVVAVKIPEGKDVASGFILDQRLLAPINTNLMHIIPAPMVERKEKKKKKRTIVIGPRPVGTSKAGSSSATAGTSEVARKELPTNSRVVVGKQILKGWWKYQAEEDARKSSKVKVQDSEY